MGMGWMMLGMIFFWGLIIFLAVLLVRALFETGKNNRRRSHNIDSPTEILDQRYGRGEISREQYLQMRKDLEER